MSGVRSSCDASPTKRRSRASDAVRSANAGSICCIIWFSASPSRPTSVCSSAVSTRRERSPAAIAPAVCCMSSSGRSPSFTTHHARIASASNTPAATTTSMNSRRVQGVGRHRAMESRRQSVAETRRASTSAADKHLAASARSEVDRVGLSEVDRRQQLRLLGGRDHLTRHDFVVPSIPQLLGRDRTARPLLAVRRRIVRPSGQLAGPQPGKRVVRSRRNDRCWR